VQALGSGGICCRLLLFSAQLTRKLIMSTVPEPASLHTSSQRAGKSPAAQWLPQLHAFECLSLDFTFFSRQLRRLRSRSEILSGAHVAETCPV